MAKILLISSQVHKELSKKQLALCLSQFENSGHQCQVEVLEAGTYEIPMVINLYEKNQAFDAYVALGLVLKKNLDHYDYIMSHIKNSFTHFALNQIIVGNGIITGESIEELSSKLDSNDPCLSGSAFKAVDCLVKLKTKVKS